MELENVEEMFPGFISNRGNNKQQSGVYSKDDEHIQSKVKSESNPTESDTFPSTIIKFEIKEEETEEEFILEHNSSDAMEYSSSPMVKTEKELTIFDDTSATETSSIIHEHGSLSMTDYEGTSKSITRHQTANDFSEDRGRNISPVINESYFVIKYEPEIVNEPLQSSAVLVPNLTATGEYFIYYYT